MDSRERRIRERAHRIWQEEGCPEGRAAEHWEMARELVAQEENQSLTTKPNPSRGSGGRPSGEPVEPLEAVENQGDIPALSDQGDRQAYPKPSARRRKQTKRQ